MPPNYHRSSSYSGGAGHYRRCCAATPHRTPKWRVSLRRPTISRPFAGFYSLATFNCFQSCKSDQVDCISFFKKIHWGHVMEKRLFGCSNWRRETSRITFWSLQANVDKTNQWAAIKKFPESGFGSCCAGDVPSFDSFLFVRRVMIVTGHGTTFSTKRQVFDESTNEMRPTWIQLRNAILRRRLTCCSRSFQWLNYCKFDNISQMNNGS